MDSPENVAIKKRNIQQLHAAEFANRLKSKADFIAYLDKHCKYPFHP